MRVAAIRRFALAGAAGALVLAGSLVRSGAANAPAAAKRPRTIVLVTVDTLRADRVGFGGYALPTTPFLDRLARDGVVFERAYATSSWTPPTMASLFTGVAPMTHGVVSGEVVEPVTVRQPVLPESLTTVAELARVIKPGGWAVVSDFHPEGEARGWKRAFRSGDHVYEIEHYPYTTERLLEAGRRAGLDLQDSHEPALDEPERRMFQAAGKEALFEEARGVPAVLVVRWKRR